MANGDNTKRSSARLLREIAQRLEPLDDFTSVYETAVALDAIADLLVAGNSTDARTAINDAIGALNDAQRAIFCHDATDAPISAAR